MLEHCNLWIEFFSFVLQLRLHTTIRYCLPISIITFNSLQLLCNSSDFWPSARTRAMLASTPVSLNAWICTTATIIDFLRYLQTLDWCFRRLWISDFWLLAWKCEIQPKIRRLRHIPLFPIREFLQPGVFQLPCSQSSCRKSVTSPPMLLPDQTEHIASDDETGSANRTLINEPEIKIRCQLHFARLHIVQQKNRLHWSAYLWISAQPTKPELPGTNYESLIFSPQCTQVGTHILLRLGFCSLKKECWTLRHCQPPNH